MGFPKRVKDPDAVLDYPADWSDWLPAGDTISDATAALSSGASFNVESVSFTATTVVAWVSGGTVAENATLTYHVTTADGREDDRSITLVCKER